MDTPWVILNKMGEIIVRKHKAKENAEWSAGARSKLDALAPKGRG